MVGVADLRRGTITRHGAEGPRMRGCGSGGRFSSGRRLLDAASAPDHSRGCRPPLRDALDVVPVEAARDGATRGVAVAIHPALPAVRRHGVDRESRVMTIRKEPSGRFRAVLKVGREYVAGRTFDTKRRRPGLAEPASVPRSRAASTRRAGRATVRSLLPVWLEERSPVRLGQDLRRRRSAAPTGPTGAGSTVRSMRSPIARSAAAS